MRDEKLKLGRTMLMILMTVMMMMMVTMMMMMMMIMMMMMMNANKVCRPACKWTNLLRTHRS